MLQRLKEEILRRMPKIQKWEYTVIAVKDPIINPDSDMSIRVLLQGLQKPGQEGWELVSVVKMTSVTVAYLKRPVQDEEADRYSHRLPQS
jgi:hypothetical protein